MYQYNVFVCCVNYAGEMDTNAIRAYITSHEDGRANGLTRIEDMDDWVICFVLE